MSARLGTLGDIDTNAWLTAGLVVPDFVPTGCQRVERQQQVISQAS